MTNVIQFPAIRTRDWSVIERSMRVNLDDAKISQAVQNRLIERMKSFYESMDPDFKFSVNLDIPTASEEQAALIRSDISEKIGAASEKLLQAFTNKLFIERFECEMDFCRELGLI